MFSLKEYLKDLKKYLFPYLDLITGLKKDQNDTIIIMIPREAKFSGTSILGDNHSINNDTWRSSVSPGPVYWEIITVIIMLPGEAMYPGTSILGDDYNISNGA